MCCSKETVDVYKHEEAVYGLSADPLNESIVASACDDGRVLVIDVRQPASEGKNDNSFHV